MKTRVISVLVLLLVLTPFAYAQAPEAGFDEYVDKAMKEWEVPGLAIAVVKDDRIVFAKGYGVRELGGTAAVNERTLFAIGSSSKAFTAATIAMLVDEGKIKWDDPVTKYLPMLPEEKLGVVILTNRGGSVLPHVLMYRVMDAYLNVADKRDWSAEILKKIKPLEDLAKAAEKKAEDERVKGTSPSLALEKYAGTYQNEMYGEAKFAFKDGKLTSEFGPNFAGDLQHWHYDTFRVVWRDPSEGKTFANFKLNSKGQPDTVTIEGIGDFTRVPDKPKPTPGAISSN